MDESRIPNALEMNVIKYAGRPDAERDRVARALVEQGRRSEAILLYDDRGDHEFMVEQGRWAVEQGASFHLLSLRRMGTVVTDDDLADCGRSAEARGRWMDAHRCWALLEDAEGLARVAPHLPESMRPEAPEPDGDEP